MERDPLETKSTQRFGYQWNPDPRTRSFTYLIKRGFNEIPVVMFASILGFFGLGCVAYGLYTYNPEDGWKSRYKKQYTVYRDCDPRIKDIKW